jgi:hypothetical protein
MTHRSRAELVPAADQNAPCIPFAEARVDVGHTIGRGVT